MTPPKKRHRLRRRRGKRAGTKHRPAEPLTLAQSPATISSLRSRLSQLATRGAADGQR